MDTARFLESDIYDEFSTKQGLRSASIYLDNLLNFGLEKRGAAHQYMKFGQSACTFRISLESQWCQGLRYIAESTTLTVQIVNLDITSFFGLSKFQLWRYMESRQGANQPGVHESAEFA